MYADAGFTLTETGFFRANDSLFFKLKGYDTSDPDQELFQLITVEDYQTIVMTLTTHYGIMTREQEKLIETMAEKSIIKKN